MSRFSGHRQRRFSWGPALALFALVCGAILFGVSSFDCRGGEPPRPKDHALRTRIEQALGACQSAAGALRGANYGLAKNEVEKVQSILREQLAALTSSERSVP